MSDIAFHNQLMNGWYWDYHTLRLFTSFLGFQNERIFAAVQRYKQEHAAERAGKSWPEIVAQEQDGLYGIVKGIECEFRGLEQGLVKLSDSLNLHEALSQCLAAFAGLRGLSGGNDECKKYIRDIPITDLRKETRTVQNFFINYENPPLDILQSIVGKPVEVQGRLVPSRVVFFLDMEYFSPYARAADDDPDVFDRLEPARKIIERELLSKGIAHSCIMTGKGYHFVSQVMASSPFMQELIEAGKVLEEGVVSRAECSHMQQSIGFQVPVSAEAAYKSIMRMSQYLYTKVIREIRARSSVPVHISDRGAECIVLDNTSQLRTAQTGIAGALGTPYHKFYEKGARLIGRVPRSYNNREWVYLRRGRQMRRYLDALRHYYIHCVGYIPEASEGLKNLFEEYKASSLFTQVHQPMDSVPHEHPWSWGHTYRREDYHYLNQWGINVWELSHNHNLTRNMLHPDVLDFFIFRLHNNGWHPKHIAGLLRSIYEDPRMGWGDFFFENCAERHANGWTEIILGQKYEHSSGTTAG